MPWQRPQVAATVAGIIEIDPKSPIEFVICHR